MISSWMQNKKREFVIIGCGTIGSVISYLLALKLKDENNRLNSIEKKDNNFILIDNDIQLKKSTHLGLIMDSKFIGYPKVLYLQTLVESIDSNINVGMIHDKVENVDLSLYKNSIIIDCRDNDDIIENTFLKISVDGNFGKFVFNPIVNQNYFGKKNFRYTIQNSMYNAICLVVQLMDIMFHDEIYKNYKHGSEYIINLDIGGGLPYEI